MMTVRTIFIAVLVVVLGVAFAFAAGNVEKGKALFNDPTFAGGTSGKSCGSCHPNGKGLEGVGSKTSWQTPGGTHSTLEEAVNTCITMALKGKPLAVKSADMQDMVAYLKTIKAATKKRRRIEGC